MSRAWSGAAVAVTTVVVTAVAVDRAEERALLGDFRMLKRA